MTGRFRDFAKAMSDAVGTYRAFLLAVIAVAAWVVVGPLFHFSDSWQLVINTATTIVTFLMVFLIQATQNRETRALHLKLDELIRAQQRARNIFADLENATEEELRELEAQFRGLRALAAAQAADEEAGARGSADAMRAEDRAVSPVAPAVRRAGRE